MTTPDSKSIPWKWLAGVLTAIILSLIGAWGVDVNQRVAALDAKKADKETVTEIRQELIAIRQDIKELLRRP